MTGNKKTPELSLPKIRIKKTPELSLPKIRIKKTPELSLPKIRIKKNAGAFAPAQVAWVEQPLRD
jgi:hypothetical protein